MNTTFLRFVVFLWAATLTVGCVSIKKESLRRSTPPPALALAKTALEQKREQRTANQLPPVLGGLIKSDSWVIYKDKEQEEFTGHVSYDNGTYIFRADHALSDRRNNSFFADGRVYLKQNGKNNSFYEAFADQAKYQYQTNQGSLTANKKKQITLRYQDEKGTLSTAKADRAVFDLNKKLYHLYGNAVLTRPTPKGLITMKADQIHADQVAEKAVLEGNAQLSSPAYSLTANTVIVDSKNNHSYAYGARPLMRGKTPQGTFAIIADKAEAENLSRKIVMNGNVQGWLVSDEINNSDLNNSF